MRLPSTALAALLVVATSGAAGVPALERLKTDLVRPVAYAIAGDSITAGRTAVEHDGLPLATDRSSWVGFVDASIAVLEEGWAYPGAKAADVAAVVSERGGFDSDYVVILAGTNDVHQEGRRSSYLASLRTIADAADSQTVLLVAIPPLRGHDDEIRAWNDSARTLAATEGWIWVDPWTNWTSADWPDGIHPTRAALSDLGDRVSVWLDLLRPRP